MGLLRCLRLGLAACELGELPAQEADVLMLVLGCGFSFFATLVRYRGWVGSGPMVREQRLQVFRAWLQQLRFSLLRVSQLLQYVLEVVVHQQSVSMGAAGDAEYQPQLRISHFGRVVRGWLRFLMAT